jgi:S-adenosylmethionine:tRNA ribosyltransferase-isomerase
MQVSDFDFDLPPELIAQFPPEVRGASRLMRLDRRSGAISHHAFTDLPDLLNPGDLLVVNDSSVFPARLIGRRLPGGGAAECLLIRPTDDADVWLALVHPGQRLRPGSRMVFERGGTVLSAEVLGRHFHGRRTVRLWTADGSPVAAAIDAVGHVPLPPYIRRADLPSDRDRYQTVYARARGSIAAPTAGLHFTPDVLDRMAARGIERLALTLHVGYGTFQPVRTSRVEDHRVEPEWFEITPVAAARLSAAVEARRRIVAVGTTTTRVLESLGGRQPGDVRPGAGETSLFIHEGHRFSMVSGLVTNFHLPRSSLLMLVAAFGGREAVLEAYRQAIAGKYRFYSYGDAMVIL